MKNIGLALLLLNFQPLLTGAGVHPRSRSRRFTATAFSIAGTTASGDQTQRGIAAGDPAVLPLGSRIRVRGAGRYSGVYTISDTGPRINGRQIDIFIPNAAEAKRFGKKRVTVQILKHVQLAK